MDTELTTDQRLAAIEARQRRYRQHDDSCAVLPKGDSLVLVNAECDCWLSREPATT